MRLDRTQRNVIKQATSSLAALALGARLADSKTLVNNPAREGHRFSHSISKVTSIFTSPKALKSGTGLGTFQLKEPE